jgi:hypothetical protein
MNNTNQVVVNDVNDLQDRRNALYADARIFGKMIDDKYVETAYWNLPPSFFTFVYQAERLLIDMGISATDIEFFELQNLVPSGICSAVMYAGLYKDLPEKTERIGGKPKI